MTKLTDLQKHDISILSEGTFHELIDLIQSNKPLEINYIHGGLIGSAPLIVIEEIKENTK